MGKILFFLLAFIVFTILIFTKTTWAIEQAEIQIVPAEIVFGEVSEGVTESQTVTLRSVGLQELILGNLFIQGEHEDKFWIGVDHCSNAILLPEELCTVEVFFNPGILNTPTQFSASMYIPNNTITGEEHVPIFGAGIIVVVTSDCSLNYSNKINFTNLVFALTFCILLFFWSCRKSIESTSSLD